MNTYLLIKTLHIISSTVVFGTGIGIAFFMFNSYRTDNIQQKLYAVRTTVLADYLFTFPAVIIQPLSGIGLVVIAGYNWTDLWLSLTYILYFLSSICWLPVVWIQIQLKKMLQVAADTNTELPKRYHRLFKVWFLLGWPAFVGLVAVFFLMVYKPT